MICRADTYAGMFEPAIVDLFAGCGGWSIGTERALVAAGHRDRYVDLAVNHWDTAVAVHSANHPLTEHRRASVWEVDPAAVLPGREIAYLHASPDCTHFSKARGSKPVKKEIRGLAWVVVRWARKRRPSVITLENVEEFKTWGPLGGDGEPCKARRGQTFRTWKTCLERLGYVVDHRELRACDYGAPTTRKRLVVVARCDGKEIIWPEKTHCCSQTTAGSLTTGKAGSSFCPAPVRVVGTTTTACPSPRSSENSATAFGHRDTPRVTERSWIACDGVSGDLRRASVVSRKQRLIEKTLRPYRTAAECIDWSIPMCSIFATPSEAAAWAKRHGLHRPRRPLADKTLTRIARGVMKYVVESAEPFIVQIQNGSNGNGVHGVDRPFPTVTANPKGGGHAIVAAYIAKHKQNSTGTSLNEPLHTITAGGANHARGAASPHAMALTAASLIKLKGTARDGQAVDEPLATVQACGNHHGLVAAFLTKHYSSGGNLQGVGEPLHTIPGIDNFGVVAVRIEGQAYVVTDIAMRMLTPRELARAQGFPDDYILNQALGGDGRVKPLSKRDQVKLIGNSVPPPLARAVVAANVACPRNGVLGVARKLEVMT